MHIKSTNADIKIKGVSTASNNINLLSFIRQQIIAKTDKKK